MCIPTGIAVGYVYGGLVSSFLIHFIFPFSFFFRLLSNSDVIPTMRNVNFTKYYLFKKKNADLHLHIKV
jgi:hypothetical protein